MMQVVIFGYDHFGRSIAKNLKHLQMDIVVVDFVAKNCKTALSDGFTAYETDLSGDEDLIDWGIGISASHLFCISGDENSNLYITLTARAIDPGLQILARAEDADAKTKLLLAGANETIDINDAASHKIFSILHSPQVAALLEGIVNRNNTFYFSEHIAMQEVAVPEGSYLDGEMLLSAEIPENFNLIVVAISKKQQSNKLVFNVGGFNHFLNKGDTLIVVGRTTDIEQFQSTLNV